MTEIRADRKVKIDLAGPFEGWWAEMKLHVPLSTPTMRVM
jgi:hypothetical protein